MNKRWKNEQGSIVIEAAIIMPLFLTFVMAMIAFVQIAVAEMSLQSSVTETTKQLAAHMYPIYLMSESESGDKIQSLWNELSELFPEPVQNLFGWHNDTMDHSNGLVTQAKNLAMLSLLKLYTDEKLLDPKQLQVTNVTLPNVLNRDQAFFGFSAEYKFKLLIPFVDKQITIRKTSYERVWVGE